MAAEAGTPQKICVVCKQDCSARKRSRDDLGRYTCQDCLDKAAAKAGKPQVVVKSASAAVAVGAKPPAAGGVPSLGALGAEPLPSYLFEETPVNLSDNEKFCNSCGKVMKKNAVLCTTCGKNQESGKVLHTVLKKPEVIKDKKRSRGIDLDGWPAYAMSGFGLLLALAIFVFTSGNEEGIRMTLIACGFGYSLIVGIFCLVAAFSSSLVAGLLYFFFWPYQIYFMLVECESRFAKLSWFASIAVAIVTWLALAKHGE